MHVAECALPKQQPRSDILRQICGLSHHMKLFLTMSMVVGIDNFPRLHHPCPGPARGLCYCLPAIARFIFCSSDYAITVMLPSRFDINNKSDIYYASPNIYHAASPVHNTHVDIHSSQLPNDPPIDNPYALNNHPYIWYSSSNPWAFTPTISNMLL